MELWSKHPHHELLVSTYGRVSRVGGEPKKLSFNGSGYLVTSTGRKGSIERVHRLVLETFVGFCPEGMECCHVDGCPTNNRLSNLRWGTREDQIADQKRHGTFSPPPHYSGKDNPAYRYDDEIRNKIVEMAKAGVRLREISRLTGVSKTQTIRIVKKEIPGFIPKDTKGENNPFWGKTHNDETKAKISRKGVRGHE